MWWVRSLLLGVCCALLAVAACQGAHSSGPGLDPPSGKQSGNLDGGGGAMKPTTTSGGAGGTSATRGGASGAAGSSSVVSMDAGSIGGAGAGGAGRNAAAGAGGGAGTELDAGVE